jgi:phage terminase small subunit
MPAKGAPGRKDALTTREQAFCDEYLKDLNATQAAIRAGYAQKGAHVQGSRLLKRTPVQVYLQAAYAAQGLTRLQTAAKLAKKVDAPAHDADDIVGEVACLARSDIGEAFDLSDPEAPKLLPISKWPERFRRAVSSIKVRKENLTVGDDRMDDVVEIKLWDKPKNLELMLKKLGLLEEKVAHTHQFEVVFDWGPDGPPPDAAALEAQYRREPDTK